MTPLPRGVRDNNPGNLRPNPAWRWDGELPPDVGAMGGYCRFSSPEHGLRALIRDGRVKRGRGLDSIMKIKAAFAPAADGNDVKAYADSVCRIMSKLLGVAVTPDGPLPAESRAFRIALAKATVRVECGDPVPHGRSSWWFDDAVFERAAAMEEAP